MIRLLRSLRRDNSGTALIEFAFVAPVMPRRKLDLGWSSRHSPGPVRGRETRRPHPRRRAVLDRRTERRLPGRPGDRPRRVLDASRQCGDRPRRGADASLHDAKRRCRLGSVREPSAAGRRTLRRGSPGRSRRARPACQGSPRVRRVSPLGSGVARLVHLPVPGACVTDRRRRSRPDAVCGRRITAARRRSRCLTRSGDAATIVPGRTSFRGRGNHPSLGHIADRP